MANQRTSHQNKTKSSHSKSLYKRILLKLSGEALQGDSAFGIDPKTITYLIEQIAQVAKLGVQIGIVIGGGNLFRGKKLSSIGIDRITGDQMGMLATVMNALAMRDALEKAKMPARIMSAIPMSGLVDHYDRRKANHHLEQQRIVLFAGGTGNPLVTTDSAASLRGIEVRADVLLKATNVDGIYTEDPAINPRAKRYKRLKFQEALDKELGVMDLTAFCQCRDHQLPIRVFNIHKAGALLRAVTGDDEGTLVD
jgi:uridylate kinase